MALWGKRDSYTLTGTVDVTNSNASVVGTGTSFLTELVPGQTVVLGDEKYKVRNIANNDHLTLTSVFEGTTDANTAATAQDAPKNLRFDEVRDIVFVDLTEAQVATNIAKGLSSPGWWQYTTHTTDGGTVTKHKAILLVALAGTQAEANDAADDSIVADS